MVGGKRGAWTRIKWCTRPRPGRRELADPRPIVARLFAVTGADGVRQIHPDLKSALNSTGGPSQDRGESPGPT